MKEGNVGRKILIFVFGTDLERKKIIKLLIIIFFYLFVLSSGSKPIIFTILINNLFGGMILSIRLKEILA